MIFRVKVISNNIQGQFTKFSRHTFIFILHYTQNCQYCYSIFLFYGKPHGDYHVQFFLYDSSLTLKDWLQITLTQLFPRNQYCDLLKKKINKACLVAHDELAQDSKALIWDLVIELSAIHIKMILTWIFILDYLPNISYPL